MSGRRTSGTLQMGHDAFLDIVANLVGILIILVVVLGTQSQQAIDEADTTDRVSYADEDQMSTLAQHAMRAAAAQADSDRLEATIKRYDAKIESEAQRRGLLLDLASEAERAWKDMQSKLAEEDVRRGQQLSESKQLQTELSELRGQKQRLQDQQRPTVQIEHLPTPMAKTVFGDEVHFRLKNNLLSVIPVDGLLDEIKRDLQHAFAGRGDGRRSSAIGPHRGYICRYEFEKSRGVVNRGGRVAMATQIRPVRFVFDPIEEPFGQPMEKILGGRSQLDIELAGRDPGTTTVTVWVYPDSFAVFRKLKEHLYHRGFATAARPMGATQKITASPNGTRSSAQ